MFLGFLHSHSQLAGSCPASGPKIGDSRGLQSREKCAQSHILLHTVVFDSFCKDARQQKWRGQGVCVLEVLSFYPFIKNQSSVLIELLRNVAISELAEPCLKIPFMLWMYAQIADLSIPHSPGQSLFVAGLWRKSMWPQHLKSQYIYIIRLNII